jgi:hypothetical protein
MKSSICVHYRREAISESAGMQMNFHLNLDPIRKNGGNIVNRIKNQRTYQHFLGMYIKMIGEDGVICWLLAMWQTRSESVGHLMRQVILLDHLD